MTTVEQCMSHDVGAVRADMTLTEAAQLMRHSGVGGIPVLGHDSDRCAGILTERDIVVRVLAEERDARTVRVRDVATLQPVTCSPDEDVAAVAKRMSEHQVQHLPVCDAGQVRGVISLADIVFERPDEERGMLDPTPLSPPR